MSPSRTRGKLADAVNPGELKVEAEFYQKRPMPPQLKQEVQTNEREIAVQRETIEKKEQEIVLINAKHDEDKPGISRSPSSAPKGTGLAAHAAGAPPRQPRPSADRRRAPPSPLPFRSGIMTDELRATSRWPAADDPRPAAPTPVHCAGCGRPLCRRRQLHFTQAVVEGLSTIRRRGEFFVLVMPPATGRSAGSGRARTP